jgi:hypothetical protein
MYEANPCECVIEHFFLLSVKLMCEINKTTIFEKRKVLLRSYQHILRSRVL